MANCVVAYILNGTSGWFLLDTSIILKTYGIFVWIDGSFESDFRDDDHGDPTMGYLFWVNGNVCSVGYFVEFQHSHQQWYNGYN